VNTHQKSLQHALSSCGLFAWAVVEELLFVELGVPKLDLSGLSPLVWKVLAPVRAPISVPDYVLYYS